MFEGRSFSIWKSPRIAWVLPALGMLLYCAAQLTGQNPPASSTGSNGATPTQPQELVQSEQVHVTFRVKDITLTPRQKPAELTSSGYLELYRKGYVPIGDATYPAGDTPSEEQVKRLFGERAAAEGGDLLRSFIMGRGESMRGGELQCEPAPEHEINVYRGGAYQRTDVWKGKERCTTGPLESVPGYPSQASIWRFEPELARLVLAAAKAIDEDQQDRDAVRLAKAKGLDIPYFNLILRDAIAWHDDTTLQFLLDQGVNLGRVWKDDRGAAYGLPGTALHWAVSYSNNLTTLRFLLDRGANPNRGFPDVPDGTPLHWCVRKVGLGDLGDRSELVAKIQLLIAHGADVNSTATQDHETPLLLAVRLKTPDPLEVRIWDEAKLKQHFMGALLFITELLQNGADPSVRDSRGVSALDAARSAADDVNRQSKKFPKWARANTLAYVNQVLDLLSNAKATPPRAPATPAPATAMDDNLRQLLGKMIADSARQPAQTQGPSQKGPSGKELAAAFDRPLATPTASTVPSLQWSRELPHRTPRATAHTWQAQNLLNEFVVLWPQTAPAAWMDKPMAAAVSVAGTTWRRLEQCECPFAPATITFARSNENAPAGQQRGRLQWPDSGSYSSRWVQKENKLYLWVTLPQTGGIEWFATVDGDVLEGRVYRWRGQDDPGEFVLWRYQLVRSPSPR